MQTMLGIGLWQRSWQSLLLHEEQGEGGVSEVFADGLLAGVTGGGVEVIRSQVQRLWHVVSS
jgi:hypothetical protein